ncbi:putative ammonium transporter sll1017 [Prorops nasuta]|uniref:putative ammonium transporter sll1017 n=1 Tax=Prorops nasuta TaxID=863751 RepID=UPI0034CED4AC
MSSSSTLDSYSYYDMPTVEGTHRHEIWISLTRVILTVMLKVGFVLLEIGSIPMNNVNTILLQNLIDFCLVSVVYLMVGFVVSYNGDLAGVIGEGHWIGQATIDKDEALIGWQAALVASSIFTSGIVGRTHVIAYLTSGVLLSGLVQPLLVHWIWTASGWMSENWLAGSPVTFKDYAGSSIVHLLGGLSGLIGCMVLGRRVLLLKDLDEASVAPASSATNFAGQLFIFLGLQSLNLPNSEMSRSMVGSNHQSGIFINGLLAGASCTLFIVAFHFILAREAFNHWTVMRCVQGIISGLVTVSAAIDVYSPLVSMAIGFISAIIFYLASKFIFHSALEDYCNIVATHFVSGLFGCLLTPFCVYSLDQNITSVFMNFAWHIICLVAIFILVIGIFLPTFLILECFGLLRNKSECLNHMRAVSALENGPSRSYMQRMFVSGDDTLFLQPGSTLRQNQKTSKFLEYQENVDRMDKTENTERIDSDTKPGSSAELRNGEIRKRASEKRKRKLRHVHTLPSRHLTYFDDSDEKIDIGWSRSARLCRSEIILRCLKEVEEKSELSKSQIIQSIEEKELTIINNSFVEKENPVKKTEKYLNLQTVLSDQDTELNVLIKPRFLSLSCESVTENSNDNTFANNEKNNNKSYIMQNKHRSDILT